MDKKQFEKELETLGAFEISAKMLKMAKNNERHNTYLNAGKGNPNWINTQARLAFARLIEFGVEESKRTMDKESLGGYTCLEGIYERLISFLDETKDCDKFLKDAFTYCKDRLGMDKDVVVKEFSDAILGNNYPVPSRCLTNIEKILNAFLEKTLYNGVSLKDSTKVFPCEGGSAAICYIFNTLEKNGLLTKGDKIAMNTPIFTPYLQIPKLSMYDMVEVDLQESAATNWEIPLSALDVLYDESIKAFFLVNPSNPGSHALSAELLEKIKEIVDVRKDLMIISDDVYGTFVDGFQSVYSVAPRNTILVYSYSKLYGATGWRVGLIAMNEKNIYDDLLANLPEEKLKALDNDYRIVTINPRAFPIVERFAADSRSIGLYHTSGLSTPQQAMMALFSLTCLLHKECDPYSETCKEIVRRRYHDLMSNLGLHEDNGRLNSKYYALLNVYELAETLYGKAFKAYLMENFEEIDFLENLAQEEGVVLMEGVGFATKPGIVRVSQANLVDEAYAKIAKRMKELMKEYYDEYLETLNS
ncbi:MAG: bifunctional aspartate transaminase/aspartate 4-decarboxylase [Longicatena sp.]